MKVSSSNGDAAIVIDSGTGEVKVIHVHKTQDGQVATHEICVMDSLATLRTASMLGTFVDAVKGALANKKPTHAAIGLTAWFRAVDEASKQFYREFFKEQLPTVQVLELTGPQEALYEASAVKYAAEASGLGPIGLQLAAGGGSVNIVTNNNPYNIETGFRVGQGLLLASGLAAIPACEKLATEKIDDFLTQYPGFASPVVESVIAISACYYAAKGTGIATEEEVASEKVVDVFTARKNAIIADITNGANDVLSSTMDKKVAQELANMILQTQVFKRLTHPNSKVFFRRDWVINGEPFRTTWTSGYFIDHAK